MTDVTLLAVDPSGNSVPRARYSFEPYPDPCFTSEGVLVEAVRGRCDLDGTADVELIPSSELTPTGSVYRVRVNEREIGYVEVPDSGTHSLLDIIVDPPASPPSAALSEHIRNHPAGLSTDDAHDWTDEQVFYWPGNTGTPDAPANNDRRMRYADDSTDGLLFEKYIGGGKNPGWSVLSSINPLTGVITFASGQVLNPTGTASGDLAGSYPSPEVWRAAHGFALQQITEGTVVNADQEVYATNATASIWKFRTETGYLIGGFEPSAEVPDGRVFIAVNASATDQDILLEARNATAMMNGRGLLMPNDIVLPPGGAMAFVWDGDSQALSGETGWRPIALWEVYASNVEYDNTESGLESDTVQGALDELAGGGGGGGAAFVGARVSAPTAVDPDTTTQLVFAAVSAPDTWDTDGYVVGNKLIVPAGKDGKHIISAAMMWPYIPANSNVGAHFWVELNGVPVGGDSERGEDNYPSGGSGFGWPLDYVSPPIYLVEDDEVTVFVKHGTGATRTPDPCVVSIERVAD